MAETLGNVTVPEIVPNGTFPIVPDYPYGRASRPDVAIHQFGTGNAKIEQRFLLGNGARRFSVRRAWLRDADRVALRNFWESHYGPFGAFTYNAPNDDGVGTTAYTCRFANKPLTWDMIADGVCTVGVTLIEVPTFAPTYPLNSAVTRFPSEAFKTALLSQVQQIIPLIKIQPLQAGYPAIYVSDRRCTVGAQLYQARLLDFDGISQGMGNESDEATFTFGNADRVMRDLANDVDLYRASLSFSLFHVGTGIKLDLWKGDIVNWEADSGPEFKVTAADGLYELNLPYPCRKITRTCWKPYGGSACPYAAHGALDLVHFPSADAGSCDKGYETPNGCLAHGMKRYYGGIIAEPQSVRIKDNSTGVFGFGRSMITSVSLVADSIYDQVIPEIYTDGPMPVNCKIAAGRDESDFYQALGIVGEGPIIAYTPAHYEDLDFDGNAETFVGSTLDGQAHHGYPNNNYGLGQCLGTDPAGATDFFSLEQSGDTTGGDWRKVHSGNSTFKDNFAAGTAFMAIRRSDTKGLQLSKPGEHAMIAKVQSGLSGWVWTAPGARTFGLPLTNPVWIVINMLLRARGLRLGVTATAQQLNLAETFFDVSAAVAAAAICNEDVPPVVCQTEKVWIPYQQDPEDPEVIIPGHWEDQTITSETQFKFRGVLQEEKPLRDWIQEVLMNCLGYYTFTFGKLKIGIRSNSSVVEAFTLGNILFNTLKLAPVKPSFNHLTANFADKDYNFVNNSLTVYDIDQATLIGGGAGPLFLKSNVNLSGTATKSQAARLISVRLREELGGITAAEWKAARQLSFRTTALALNVDPGMVCSMTHPDMPGGAGEFRVGSWRLNRDYSIDILGRTTTDSMYDLVAGPKPADVQPSPLPVEPRDYDNAVPPPPVFGVSPQMGFLVLGSPAFTTLQNTKTITALTYTVWHYDESAPTQTTLQGGITDSDTSLTGASLAQFLDGDLALVGAEIVKLAHITGNTAEIERAQKESVAAAHLAGARLVRLKKTVLIYPVPISFFERPEAAEWEAREPLRCCAIAAVEMYVTNIFGNSPVTVNNYTTAFVDDRLRVLSGDQVDLIVEGILGIESDCVPPVYLRQATSIWQIYAYCKTAPQGGNITAVVKVAGTAIGTVQINDGQWYPANAIEGRDLPAILPSQPITLDITGVGLTYPGERLVVTIRM